MDRCYSEQIIISTDCLLYVQPMLKIYLNLIVHSFSKIKMIFFLKM